MAAVKRTPTRKRSHGICTPNTDERTLKNLSKNKRVSFPTINCKPATPVRRGVKLKSQDSM